MLARALRADMRLSVLHLEGCNLSGRPLFLLSKCYSQTLALKQLRKKQIISAWFWHSCLSKVHKQHVSGFKSDEYIFSMELQNSSSVLKFCDTLSFVCNRNLDCVLKIIDSIEDRKIVQWNFRLLFCFATLNIATVCNWILNMTITIHVQLTCMQFKSTQSDIKMLQFMN